MEVKFRRCAQAYAFDRMAVYLSREGLSFVDDHPMLCFVTPMPVSFRTSFGPSALASASAQAASAIGLVGIEGRGGYYGVDRSFIRTR
jgi:hypothetical protein